MGRRAKAESMFDGLPDPAPDPVDPSELAQDELDILEGRTPSYKELPTKTDIPSAEEPDSRTHDPAAPKEPRKKRGDDGRPLRDRIREAAGRTQFGRIKIYEALIKRENTPLPIKMECLKRLDELALDKTGTAAPVGATRPRILIGHSGGIRPGSDVMKPTIGA